jgi:hypothetical protein
MTATDRLLGIVRFHMDCLTICTVFFLSLLKVNRSARLYLQVSCREKIFTRYVEYLSQTVVIISYVF